MSKNFKRLKKRLKKKIKNFCRKLKKKCRKIEKMSNNWENVEKLRKCPKIDKMSKQIRNKKYKSNFAKHKFLVWNILGLKSMRNIIFFRILFFILKKLGHYQKFLQKLYNFSFLNFFVFGIFGSFRIACFCNLRFYSVLDFWGCHNLVFSFLPSLVFLASLLAYIAFSRVTK